METNRALPAGSSVAAWQVGRMLGAGGFGITYEARHMASGAHVALKEFIPTGLCSRAIESGRVAAAQGPPAEIFKRGLRSFMKEAETLARLDHPSIVRVAEYFEANGTAYMALGFEAGGSLHDAILSLRAQGRSFTQDQLDRLLWPITEALIQVHSIGVLHRDIKPENVMLRPDGTPVLIDFGAVKQIVSHNTRTAGSVATLNVATDGYAPPEQYVSAPEGERLLGPWTDVYALAGTIYEVIAGKRPPAAPLRQVDRTVYRSLGSDARNGGSNWRPQMLAGIDQALALDAADRPRTIVEFRRAIGLVQPTRTDVRAPSRELRRTLGGLEQPTDVALPVATQRPKSLDPAPGSRLDPSFIPTGAHVPAGSGQSASPPVKPVVQPWLLAFAVLAFFVVVLAIVAGGAIYQLLSPSNRSAGVSPRDPIAALLPGSGLSARDRLADGSACPFCPEMLVVPAGQFTMGSPVGEPERERWLPGSESPQRGVSISRSFAIGRYAVTRGEFAAFVQDSGYKMDSGCASWGGNTWKLQAGNSWRSPGFEQTDRHPVVCTSWDDAKAFAAWLSRKTGKAYRLPSEAEREYVTRAGTTTPYWWGTTITPAQANYDGSADPYQGGGTKGEYRRRTVTVDSFLANPWGLYQVHGNVWEWMEDCWHNDYQGAPVDGSAWITACSDGGQRALRGGSWNFLPRILRSAGRQREHSGVRFDNLGFRLTRTLAP